MRDDPGFGDDGQIVPAVDFDYPESTGGNDEMARVRREVICRLVAFLGQGANAQLAGRRLVLLAHIINPTRSQRELARAMGMHEGAVSRAVKRLRAQIVALSED